MPGYDSGSASLQEDLELMSDLKPWKGSGEGSSTSDPTMWDGYMLGLDRLLPHSWSKLEADR